MLSLYMQLPLIAYMYRILLMAILYRGCGDHINMWRNFALIISEDNGIGPANRNYTRQPDGQQELHTDPNPQDDLGQVNVSPPPPPLNQRGQLRQREQRAVLDKTGEMEDMDVLRCPWNSATLAFQAQADKRRLGQQSTGAVQPGGYCGGHFKTATCNAIMSAV